MVHSFDLFAYLFYKRNFDIEHSIIQKSSNSLKFLGERNFVIYCFFVLLLSTIIVLLYFIYYHYAEVIQYPLAKIAVC